MLIAPTRDDDLIGAFGSSTARGCRCRDRCPGPAISPWLQEKLPENGGAAQIGEAFIVIPGLYRRPSGIGPDQLNQD